MNGKKIRLSKSSISEAEKSAVLDVLDTEFLGMGAEVAHFEKEIKVYLQTEMEVACVSTGTAALHLALVALELGEGDEVLVPSITYVASYQAISATGATPVSCEVLSDTLFIDINDAERKVTLKTKAIMPVHYASSSVGMQEVYIFAQKHDLRVVEDAAQAFGSRRNGTLVGVSGDIICFSFDGIKNITSGEGGAILSKDRELMQKVQDSRLLAIEKDTQKRFSGQRSWDFDVKLQGFRYHMSNIMAAIGRVQLTRLESFKEKRQSVARKYVKELNALESVTFLSFDYQEVVPHIFVIKAQDRDNLRQFLLDNLIECGIHYKPNHLLTKYQTSELLAVSEALYSEILTLPCHNDLSDKEQDYVIEKIKEFYGK